MGSSGSRGGESSAEPLDEGKKATELSGPLAEGAQARGTEKGKLSRDRDGSDFPDVETKCRLREVMQVIQDHTAGVQMQAEAAHSDSWRHRHKTDPEGPAPSCWAGFLLLAVLYVRTWVKMSTTTLL